MTEAIDQFRVQLSRYASSDSPPARIMASMAEVCEQLQASQADLARRMEALPLGNVDEMLRRAARKARLDDGPEAARVRMWQRWSAVATAAVACAGVIVCVSVVVWEVTRVRPDEPSVVTQCADPGHQYAVSGGLACRAWVRPPAAGL